MKAFVLMSAAWLSGAGGDPAPAVAPAPAPIVSPAPIIGGTSSGACCGNTAPAVTSAPITGSCACDPCAQATSAAPAPAPKQGLLAKLFGKKPAAPAAAPASDSACGCAAAPVAGTACGCAAAPATPVANCNTCGTATTIAAPAPEKKSGGIFPRLFGSKQEAAPAAAPVYSHGAIISTPAAPGCSNCGAGAVISGAPATAVIHGPPGHLPTVGTPLPSAPLPSTPVGTPVVTPAPLPTGNPLPPAPIGPEGIKEAPKEPMKLPAVGGEKGLQPTSGTRPESGGRLPFEDHHRQQAQMGSAADYSRVTGRLSYVHVDGGLWILRYASLDQVDKNGGSVVLQKDRRMDSYREGDIVTVQGTVTDERATPRLAAPIYRATSIQLVDRPAN